MPADQYHAANHQQINFAKTVDQKRRDRKRFGVASAFSAKQGSQKRNFAIDKRKASP